jgi:3-phenylpropionate/trans-cinnamate dioxygenase ferredoxin subunit
MSAMTRDHGDFFRLRCWLRPFTVVRQTIKTIWENFSMAIKIMPKPNGPYLVTGDLSQLEFTDINGNKYDVTGKQTVALCRCGASVNKPFCDGTHSKIGFQAAEAAVKKEG